MGRTLEAGGLSDEEISAIELAAAKWPSVEPDQLRPILDSVMGLFYSECAKANFVPPKDCKIGLGIRISSEGWKRISLHMFMNGIEEFAFLYFNPAQSRDTHGVLLLIEKAIESIVNDHRKRLAS